MRCLIPTCPYISCPIFTLLCRTAIACFNIVSHVFHLGLDKRLEYSIDYWIVKVWPVGSSKPTKKRIKDGVTNFDGIFWSEELLNLLSL